MFSANISGQIKRVIHDNDKDGKDAIIKFVVETRKQFAKKDDMPNVYPLVTVFGHDAAYVREYAGVGHWVEAVNCDMDVYRPDDADEDRISFKAGRISLLPKQLSEAVGDVVADEEDEEPRRKKKRPGSSTGTRKTSSSSRSARRGRRDEVEDDAEEEEAPRRRKRAGERKGKASDGARKRPPAASSKRKKEEPDDDYDEDYDDDDEDDDDYFDEDDE